MKQTHTTDSVKNNSFILKSKSKPKTQNYQKLVNYFLIS